MVSPWTKALTGIMYYSNFGTFVGDNIAKFRNPSITSIIFRARKDPSVKLLLDFKDSFPETQSASEYFDQIYENITTIPDLYQRYNEMLPPVTLLPVASGDSLPNNFQNLLENIVQTRTDLNNFLGYDDTITHSFSEYFISATHELTEAKIEHLAQAKDSVTNLTSLAQEIHDFCQDITEYEKKKEFLDIVSVASRINPEMGNHYLEEMWNPYAAEDSNINHQSLLEFTNALYHKNATFRALAIDLNNPYSIPFKDYPPDSDTFRVPYELFRRTRRPDGPFNNYSNVLTTVWNSDLTPDEQVDHLFELMKSFKSDQSMIDRKLRDASQFPIHCSDMVNLRDYCYQSEPDPIKAFTLYNGMFDIFDSFPVFKYSVKDMERSGKGDEIRAFWWLLHDTYKNSIGDLGKNFTGLPVDLNDRIDFVKEFTYRYKALTDIDPRPFGHPLLYKYFIYLNQHLNHGQEDFSSDFDDAIQLENIYQKFKLQRNCLVSDIVKSINKKFEHKQKDTNLYEFNEGDTIDLRKYIYRLPKSARLYQKATVGNDDYFVLKYQQAILANPTNADLYKLEKTKGTNIEDAVFVCLGGGTIKEELPVIKKFIENNSSLKNIKVYSVDESLAMTESASERANVANELHSIRGNLSIEVQPIQSDFLDMSDLSKKIEPVLVDGERRQNVFLGLTSLYSNFGSDEQETLSNNVHHVMKPGDRYVIGQALVEDETTYRDRLTEAFGYYNLSLGIFDVPQRVIDFKCDIDQTGKRTMYFQFNQDHEQSVKIPQENNPTEFDEYVFRYAKDQKIQMGSSERFADVGQGTPEIRSIDQILGPRFDKYKIVGYRNKEITHNIINSAFSDRVQLPYGIYSIQKPLAV
ncbi:MAG: L-histidine N(alpha)-methyltransferase [Nanoarchaeota archaeon]|nr:L-histidine N(alpha)-methyltransferase [Nanoarchaeota archaeon]